MHPREEGSAIDPEERAALLAQVERFARRSIEPRVERHETPLDPAALLALMDEAESLGLAGSLEDPSGLGPWEGLAEGGAPGSTLELLSRIGEADASSAFALHQRALGRSAAAQAGLPAASLTPLEPVSIAAQGVYGLGRDAIARWLHGAPAEAEDAELLADTYESRRPRIVTLEPAFAGLISPEWDGGAVQWRLDGRATLGAEPRGPAHGLDALETVELRALGAPLARSSLGERRSKEVFAAILGAQQLALVAIAKGSVARGLRLARAYAAERQQGGKKIARHPAVMQLLGGCRAELQLVEALLDRASRIRLDPSGFIAALGTRSRAMPALASAANAALQVFGGIGYMRDAGAERVVRDTNHLRAIGGPLGEIELIVAEWERHHER